MVNIISFIAIALLLSLLFSDISHAASSSSSTSDPIGQQLCFMIYYLQSGVLKAVSLVAVIVVAFMFIGGKMQWQTVATIMVGIIVVNSSSTILSSMTGQDFSSCANTSTP